MGLGHSPSIVTSNLVMCLDAANYKSFKGVPATNLLYALFDTNGTVNTTDFKTSYGSEVDFIPSLGYRTVRYCNIYNNYPTSGNCCPRLFDYGGNAFSKNITVSPSTTYTYEIIYKVSSGYTSANYMYRYEYNGGTYVTEAGVHSDSNRTSLGNGWYHAWGQFTTSATTNNLWATGMWYYQYGVYDKVSVAGASLHQGTYIIPPEHMLAAQENRGATVATGGGWADIIGNSNHGTLTNGPLYSSTNGGSVVFDGVDDYISTGLVLPSPSTTPTTFDLVFKYNSSNAYRGLIGASNYAVSGFSIGFMGQSSITMTYNAAGLAYENPWSYDSSIISHGTFVFNGRNISAYRNGSLIATYTSSFDAVANAAGIDIGRNQQGGWGTSQCNIYCARVYNKALTATEVAQNFNALRGRYGV